LNGEARSGDGRSAQAANDSLDALSVSAVKRDLGVDVEPVHFGDGLSGAAELGADQPVSALLDLREDGAAPAERMHHLAADPAVARAAAPRRGYDDGPPVALDLETGVRRALKAPVSVCGPYLVERRATKVVLFEGVATAPQSSFRVAACTTAATDENATRIALGTPEALRVFDLRSGDALLDLPAPKGVAAVVLSPDGQWVAAASAAAPQITLVDVAGGQAQILKGLRKGGGQLAFAGDRLVAVAGTLACSWSLEGGSARKLAFSPPVLVGGLSDGHAVLAHATKLDWTRDLAVFGPDGKLAWQDKHAGAVTPPLGDLFAYFGAKRLTFCHGPKRVRHTALAYPFHFARFVGGSNRIVCSAFRDPKLYIVDAATGELVGEPPPTSRPSQRLVKGGSAAVAPVAQPEASPQLRALDDEEAFVSRLLADPDDDAVWQVFGDWLASRGDPRGELIALDFHGAESVHDAHDRCSAQILGTLTAVRGCSFALGRGHVLGARVDSSRAPAALRTLKKHPQSRLLRSVYVRGGASKTCYALAELLEARAIRELGIDASQGLDSTYMLEVAGDAITHLDLEVDRFGFEPLAKLRKLRWLHLSPYGLSRESLAPLGLMPDLEVLSLSSMMNADFTPLACLPKLRTLGISGIKRVAGLEGLCHLREVWLDPSSIPEATIAALEARPEVTVHRTLEGVRLPSPLRRHHETPFERLLSSL
jgi:uncharacterized protein (TIGR02996 family)